MLFITLFVSVSNIMMIFFFRRKDGKVSAVNNQGKVLYTVNFFTSNYEVLIEIQYTFYNNCNHHNRFRNKTNYFTL